MIMRKKEKKSFLVFFFYNDDLAAEAEPNRRFLFGLLSNDVASDVADFVILGVVVIVDGFCVVGVFNPSISSMSHGSLQSFSINEAKIRMATTESPIVSRSSPLNKAVFQYQTIFNIKTV